MNTQFIRIPTLALMGEKDDATSLPKLEALQIIKSKATTAPRFDIAVIEGATHSYFSKENEMTKAITK